ncbi:MAG: hypothetical protein ACRC26_06560, partial [Bacteroidales bacterium]
MLFENLEKSPVEIALCLLPLFIVGVFGIYTIIQWLKGNNEPAKNMQIVLCFLIGLIVLGGGIYFLKGTVLYVVIAFVMILGLIATIAGIISEIKRRNR